MKSWPKLQIFYEKSPHYTLHVSKSDCEALGAVWESFDKASLKKSLKQTYTADKLITLLCCLYKFNTKASLQLSKMRWALKTTIPVTLSIGSRFFNKSTTRILAGRKWIPPHRYSSILKFATMIMNRLLALFTFCLQYHAQCTHADNWAFDQSTFARHLWHLAPRLDYQGLGTPLEYSAALNQGSILWKRTF